MIENDAQLKQTVECLGMMYSALAELYRRVYPVNPKNFALMAQGPVDDIRKLQREINEYVGLSLAEELDVKLWRDPRDEDASPEPVRTAASRTKRG
ncbi:MAG TPA: hypothetical protein VGM03_23255 [Phycisphaerae bacterium]|jgi:hypothetical protein